MRNVVRAVGTPGWWRRIGHDSFRDEIMWCEWRGPGAGQWRSWSDNDYTECRVQLEHDGFQPVGRELVRDAVALVAGGARFDSAQVWLDRLKWDRVPRVSTFLERYAGAEAGKYAAAVSSYLWTALAGRVLAPGCKADMVPILVGAGGARKTSLVAALAPDPQFARRVDLKHDDAAIARTLRGCLVAEVAELRGLRGRDSESIKDFFSADRDTWTPKYRELAATVMRRCVFVGTTDDDAFLTDAVGNYRRWLPVRIGVAGEIGIEALVRDREQLWAEAADRFVSGGVEWQSAEALARFEHGDFVIDDAWAETISAWAYEKAETDISLASADPGANLGATWAEKGFSAKEALIFGVGLPLSAINRGTEMRAVSILKGLGFASKRGLRSAGNRNVRIWTKKCANLGSYANL